VILDHPRAPAFPHDALTPRQIVAELDRYIVGQHAAKRAVAVALRNRWRRQAVEGDLRAEINPSNIILVGPTGVGKTEIARRLAKLARAPFLKVEASKFTEVGYVGRDVESMVRDLVEVSILLVREEARVGLEAQARDRAQERLLDLLLPVPPPLRPFEEMSDAEREQSERREASRDKLRARLRDGDLDAREVEIEVAPKRSGTIDLFGPQGLEQLGFNLQDLAGGSRKTRRKVPISEARRILEEEELENLLDKDKLIIEAMERAQSSGLIFIDEIDKILSRPGTHGGPDVSREGVQRDLLPVVEGSSVTTKHGTVKTDHILFIAAGAFHGTSPSDLIPELQGRFPIRVELSSLNAEDFVRILREPESALLRQYQAMLASEGVALEFTEDAVLEIARVAWQANESSENIGARRLQTVMAALLEPEMFDIPDRASPQLTIDAALVHERLDGLLRDEDVRRYIL
jgi:ATP-dependent HslUV protease ATP-binding subunit HslU